ncbi:MAG TPA: hypothetical protein DD658_04755 [Deltaproteobacteria bacterium]|nr:MAG: hypothetical protein A2X88_06555 [Deltaproteobacteria bacterium GWC2_65_14]HBO69476.1 hypothetical protein [Deltaproteobacteria bacterium]
MSSLAVDPMDRLMQRMLVLSAGLHLLGLLFGVAWAAWVYAPARFIPVAVVDLVGGADFAAPKPSPPLASAKEHSAPAPAAKAEPSRKSTPAKVPSREAPDTGSLSERIRKMREEQSSSDRVREAVGTLRKEKAARSAVRQIGERVAHRVDLSGLRPAPRAKTPAGTGAVIGGAAGTSRVPPETLAYFRELDERIRSNWTVPELAPSDSRNLIVQIRITIEQDGKVSNVRMEKTSANSYFDDSVLRAIHKASPLPVPPEQLRGTEDHYEIGFRFFGGGETS